MENLRLRVVLGWHMHQPEYREPEGGQYRLPWTYLHAIKDYADMAAHLERVEDARAVVNFAPLLLEQLADYAAQVEAFGARGAPLRDPLLAGLAADPLPAEAETRLALLRDGLRAHPQRLIARYPAYEALARRAESLRERPDDVGDAFLADLLVWYHLAWMGESVKREDAFLQALIAQEGGYTVAQRRALVALIGRICGGIVPRYRRLWEADRVELSVTPYGHPILPLLLDIGSAAEAMPGAPLPERRYPGGEARARWHLARAIDVFESAFGRRPAGCWCSEGAVSADALGLLPEAGLAWSASGQGVLGHSLGAQAPSFPVHPYRVSPDHPALFFRDDDLSDRIGFRYSGIDAREAVDDLVRALEERAAVSPPGAVVTIFLDGENAWEHYPENGWAFLSGLYTALAAHPNLRLTTFSDVLAEHPKVAPLPHLVTGSWVYGTLSTWIGAADKNRGWDLLIDAKLAYDRYAATRPPARALAAAERQLGICEGSDWFWWLGDYNPAAAVADFEWLYRQQLAALYRLIGEPAPAALGEVLSRGHGDPAAGGVMRTGSEAPAPPLPPADLFARRRAGVLAHIASLPGARGGDFSHDAYRFVEFAAACGFTVWQVLPLGPTDASGSPYLSVSAHAGNPEFLSLDWLVDRGWLTRRDVDVDAPAPEGWASRRRGLLRQAHAEFQREAGPAWRARHAAFMRDHASWLDDYALFVALAAEHADASWTHWPKGLRDRDPAVLEQARARHAPALAQTAFEQWLFFTQWAELRSYAHRHGVYLFGDVPIFVGHQSADVWANRSLFQLDASGESRKVAGVPPDYFAVDGQRWGNPLYAWDAHVATGFAWWIGRLRTQLALFDLVRIDHFRGLSACWEIPVEAKSAREGSWVPTPGAELLDAARAAFGRLPLVAEDLGVITPEVEALRVAFGLPGMRVLQFGFDGSPHNVHLPQNFEPLTVAYSGTHDNATTREWFEALDPHTRGLVTALFARNEEPVPWPVLHATLSSVARLAVLPMQDLLGLPAGNRMNTPGTVEGNWRWRFDWRSVPGDLARHLRELNWRYGRG